MTNGQINKTFLDRVDLTIQAQILTEIAKRYRITTQDAFGEVTDEEAEHLLDYLTGSVRSAVSVLMQRS